MEGLAGRDDSTVDGWIRRKTGRLSASEFDEMSWSRGVVGGREATARDSARNRNEFAKVEAACTLRTSPNVPNAMPGLPPVTGHSQELLLEPCDFPASPSTVHTLSTLQLAIASLRGDLDLLTRQRAYASWVARRMCWEPESGGNPERKLSCELQANRRADLLTAALFELSVDALPLDDLPSLSPAELLLAQFSPRASLSLVASAGALFFARAEEAKSRLPVEEIRAEMKVYVLVLEKDGTKREERKQLGLRVGSEGLTVVMDGKDELCADRGRSHIRVRL